MAYTLYGIEDSCIKTAHWLNNCWVGLAVACGYSGRALARVASGNAGPAAVLAGRTGWLLSGRDCMWLMRQMAVPGSWRY